MTITLEGKTAEDLHRIAHEAGYDNVIDYLHAEVIDPAIVDAAPQKAADVSPPPEVLAEVRRRQGDDRANDLTLEEFAEKLRADLFPHVPADEWEHRWKRRQNA